MTCKACHGINKPGGGSPAPIIIAALGGERDTRTQPQLQG